MPEILLIGSFPDLLQPWNATCVLYRWESLYLLAPNIRGPRLRILPFENRTPPRAFQEM